METREDAGSGKGKGKDLDESVEDEALVDCDPEASMDDPVILPIEETLDLHAFRPGEVKSLVVDYLDEAVKMGFREVRIIHGKGMGALRRTVHAVLERHPSVISHREAEPGSGGWGATRVILKPEGE